MMKHLLNGTEYSAFQESLTNINCAIVVDKQFTDVKPDGAYAVNQTAKELPRYPLVLVYTAIKFIPTLSLVNLALAKH